MSPKKKNTKSELAQKTIKVSAENHKKLNLYRVENDLKTMDAAIGELLRIYEEYAA